jgi:DNA-binding SARP family transcriptional activator/streptogramin lyase
MLEYRVLGPLEVLRDGRPVALGKGAERALLALLVLHPSRPLSTDELVEALWGERPPPTAREMVRNYVGSARRRLGGDAIETTQHGYLLTAAGESVDLRRFERLARDGRTAFAAGDVEAAAETLEGALALWRGRPLPELDDVPAAAADVRQFEELHAAALEDWFDTQLELDRAPQVVTSLEAFVDEHPYRERPLRQLILALYRSGRQKDALDRFAAARRRLVDETGLEPGPELRDLQVRILRQDPSLDLPVGQMRASPAPPVGRKRRSLAAAALLAVAGAAAAAAVSLWPRAGPVAVPDRGVLELDQRTGKPVAATRLALEPGPIAVAAGRVWLGDSSAKSLVELQPRRRRVALPRVPFALAATSDGVWVANGFDGTLIRVDESGQAQAPIRPEPGSVGRLALSASRGVLWIGSQDGTLTELSQAGGTIGVIHGVGLPETVAAGDGTVWIGRATEDAVVRVDARSRRLRATIPIGGRPDIVATGDGSVWAMTADTSMLWRIDPRTDAVTASVPLPAKPTALAVTQDGVWVGSGSGLLAQIDPATNTVRRTRLLGRPIDALSAGDGRLWAAVG